MTFKERYLEEEDSSVSDIKSSGPSATEQQLKNDVTDQVQVEAKADTRNLGGPEVTKAPEKGSDYLANKLRPETDTKPSFGDNQKFQGLVDRLSGRKTPIL